MVLVHLSDCHLDQSPRSRSRLTAAVRYVTAHRHEIDAVVITGDIADHGLVAEYQEGVRLGLVDMHPTTLICPGNHDARDNFNAVLLGKPPGPHPINRFHDVGSIRVVLCDSTIPGRAEGRLSEETLLWLHDALRTTPPGMRAVVAMHHVPIALNNALMDPIRLQESDRLEAILSAQTNVVGLLCGHAHTASVSSFAGRPLVIAPALASTIAMPWSDAAELDFGAPPAAAVHVVDENGSLTTHFRVIPLMGWGE